MLPQPSVLDLTSILQLCGQRSKACILRLHAYVAKRGLEGTSSVGNELVRRLADWGLVGDARQIFDRLLHRKELSWSSLIFGYVNCERPDDALELYNRKVSHQDFSSLSAQTIVAVLKASAKLKKVDVGLEVHSAIDRLKLLDQNLHVASALLVMYVKCGFLEKAQEVFDKLSKKNVVIWTALIAGYVEHGFVEKALEYFEQMQAEGVFPTEITFMCTLKACSCVGDIGKGQELHCEIARRGLLQRAIFVGIALVDMYRKCSSLLMGREVFDMLPFRNLVAWNILITGYAELEYGMEVLACFERMQVEGIRPDTITYLCVLKACSNIGDIDKGMAVHAELARQWLLKSDIVVCNSLVDMYAKCGQLIFAQHVFNSMTTKDVVSWTILIAGYADHGLGNEAIMSFEQMQLMGFSPNDVALLCGLKACGSIGDANKGLDLHVQIEKFGFSKENTLVGNILVDMYSRCGLLTVAHSICENLPLQSVAAWNAMIAGYVNCGYGEEAIYCLKEMQRKCVTPDSVTFIFSLKACAIMQAIGIGKRIHGEIERRGLVDDNCMLANTLINMYAKCGFLSVAQQIYINLKEKDVASKTSLLVSYTEHGQNKQIIDCIQQQWTSDLCLDAVTFICCLKACGRAGAGAEGQKLHFELERQGMLEKDPAIGNTLIDMYSKLGLFDVCRHLFDGLSVHNVVSWTVLIASYVEQQLGEEAFKCLELMQLEGVSPGSATFICILKACAIMGSELKVQEVFADIERQGLDEIVELNNTLVSTYAKMGLLVRAQYIFDKISNRDIVAWNALMTGYGKAGKNGNVFDLFTRMLREGFDPDLNTFIVVLNACSRKGNLLDILTLFDCMRNDYGLVPALEHHTCIVDILGRLGHLEKAVALIKKMPFSPDHVVWDTVLGACRSWGEEGFAKQAIVSGSGEVRGSVSLFMLS